MTDYVKVEDAQIDFDSGVGQDVVFQARDNQENHQARISQLERSLRTFDHMNWGAPGTTNPPTDSIRVTNSHADSNLVIAVFSVWTLNGSLTGAPGIQVMRNFIFTQVTRPILFVARIKKLLDVDMRVGLRLVQAGTGGLPADASGIWLERVDASDWRFVSYDSARNNGTSFGKIADGTWFDVEIEFTDTPSNRALCRIDSVLKETLTTELPTAATLHGAIMSAGSGAPPGANVMDMDLIDYGAAGLADAP